MTLSRAILERRVRRKRARRSGAGVGHEPLGPSGEQGPRRLEGEKQLTLRLSFPRVVSAYPGNFGRGIPRAWRLRTDQPGRSQTE